MLNRIWSLFIIITLSWGIVLSFSHDSSVANDIVKNLFEMAELSATICLGLIGAMCFWLGLFKIAEESGLTKKLRMDLRHYLIHLCPKPQEVIRQ